MNLSTDKIQKFTTLFKRDNLINAKAWKTELGFNTERFKIDSINEGIEWLNESKSNSIKLFNGNLFGKDEDINIEIIKL